MRVSRAAAELFAALLLAAGLTAAGCTVSPPPDPGATPVVPMASPSQAVAAAAQEVERELAAAGLRLERPNVEHRPGEPAAVQFAPRAVYRVPLASPNEGWVLVYDLGSPEAARQAGAAFAAYLGSGVGQTNYPRDAQFALSQLGDALVYSYWSRERSTDAAAAEAAFEAIKRAGQPIEVRR